MNTNNYQVWEGEIEAAGLEENGISFFSAFFSALLGIVLFFVLIAKTIVLFPVRAFVHKKKITRGVTNPALEMSVS